MAKFLYSMQNVLDIKERLETQAKTEYAEMNNRLFIEEETMKRLGKRLDSYENLARSSASERLDIMEMRRCNEAIDIIKNQMTQQAVRIRIAQRNVDNAMKPTSIIFTKRTIGLLNCLSCIVKYRFLSMLEASTIFKIRSTCSFCKKCLDTFSSLENVSIA